MPTNKRKRSHFMGESIKGLTRGKDAKYHAPRRQHSTRQERTR